MVCASRLSSTLTKAQLALHTTDEGYGDTKQTCPSVSSLTNFVRFCSQSIREDRGNQVKSASSCVSGSDRHAEQQLFQSTNLPTSGIAGRFANVAEKPEATIKHIHAACRRGQHLLAVEPRHVHAAAVWQRKQTQVGSQKFQVSSSFK